MALHSPNQSGVGYVVAMQIMHTSASRQMGPKSGDTTCLSILCAGLFTEQVRRNVINNYRLLRDVVMYVCSAEPFLNEVGRSTRGSNAQTEERGDILVAHPSRMIVIDVSVIHPTAPSFLRKAQNPGGAAKERDDLKTRQYRNGGYQGFQFIPFSVETFGRFGQPAMDFLRNLSQIAAGPGRFDQETLLAGAYRELAIALARGNQAVFRSGLSVFAKTSGVVPLPGASIPYLEE